MLFFFCLYLYERNLKGILKYEITRLTGNKYATIWNQKFK